MKVILAFFFVFIINLPTMAQLGADFKLPKTWEKDFVVTVSHTGSMSGHESHIRITYDSCTYIATSRKGGKDEKKVYLMKEKDRAELLKKFDELKVDKIKSESGKFAVHDGWQHSICFGFNCIEGGTSAEMSEKDKNNFLDASRTIEDFAELKTKKK